MRFPELHNYLSRLKHGEPGDSRLWTDRAGRVQGQFFNCALTSLFQPVRALDGELLAFDAHAHSYSQEDRGLSVWRLLNSAASDDESIELDRLCRMLHVLNFFRQTDDDASALLIGVHERLLAAVNSNHGAVFRHILDGLGLPVGRVLLQLPQASAERNWAIGFVVDNYRRNGFRIATHARDVAEAGRQLEQLRPEMVRIDSHASGNIEQLAHLIEHASALHVRLLFSRVDVKADLLRIIEALSLSSTGTGEHLWIQGAHAGAPEPALPASVLSSALSAPAPAKPARSESSLASQLRDRKVASSFA